MTAPARLSIDIPGVGVEGLTWGPSDGPLALCLHGYPDTAWTYRHLGPHLADRGWRVVAPFSRGYAPTGFPDDGAYQAGALVGDALALRHALGDERTVLIGHDWGAIAATGAAASEPHSFAKLVLLAVPPIPVLTAQPKFLPRQLPRSWYALVNQVPVVPELLFEPFVKLLWRTWSPGYDATEDLAHPRDALPTTRHRTAALRYYRATAQPWRHRSAHRSRPRLLTAVAPVPTLYLHGAQDGCCGAEYAQYAQTLLPDGSAVQVVDDSGHFLQLERPTEVNALISDFIGDAAPHGSVACRGSISLHGRALEEERANGGSSCSRQQEDQPPAALRAQGRQA